MDTTPNVSPGTSAYVPPPIVPSRPKPSPDPVGRNVLIAVVALILLVLLGYAAFRYWGGQHRMTGGLPNDTRIVLAADSLPSPAARVVDLAAHTLLPLTVEAQGTATLLDEALTDTQGYYLLTGPEANSSNLYRQDRANPAAGLTQLTHSATYKIDLSRDATTGIAAYVTRAVDGTHIVVWNPASDTEKDLGRGSRPVVLPGGSYVLFVRDGRLMSKHISTGREQELVPVAADAPFAIDTEHLAVYDPAARAVQYYTVTETGLIPEESVTSLETAPKELVYSDGKLLVAYAVPDMLVLRAVDGSASLEVPVPGLSLDGLKISVHHDPAK